MSTRVKHAITVCAAGDGLFYRPAGRTLRESGALLQIIREADVSFVNLEAPIGDASAYPTKHYSWGGYPFAPDWVPFELSRAGFNVVSLANNHMMNYSGATIAHNRALLEHAGIAVSGAGQSLQQARQPGYVNTAAGRVALIAIDTSFEWGEFQQVQMASDSLGSIPGRPGVNGVRWYVEYTAVPDAFDALRHFAQEVNRFPGHFPTNCSDDLDAPREPFNASALGMGTWKTGPDDLVFMGKLIRRGTNNAAQTYCDARDVEANLESIARAREDGNYVLVSCHSHECDASDAQQPADHVRQLARACIDAGAHAWIGHGGGWKGVEVHRGRPIFYDLGKFAEEYEENRDFPADLFDAWRLSADTSADEYFAVRSRLFETLQGDPLLKLMQSYAHGLFATFKLQRDEVSEIELYSCERSGSPEDGGSPRFAPADKRRAHFADLISASAALGTRIEDKGETVAVTGTA